MCRLAFIPKAFDGMADWLVQMEASMGGHGTGVACGELMFKGRDVSAIDSAREISLLHRQQAKAKKRRQPVLWHTRFTSSGGHHDDLCHPFECDGGWLVHNGHWAAFAAQAAKVDTMPMSDTRLFAFLVERSGFEKMVSDLQPPGVWLHMRYDGSLAVHKRGGTLCFNPKLGAWGSEPPTKAAHDWYDVADGTYEHGVEPVLTQRAVVKQPLFAWTGSRTPRTVQHAMDGERDTFRPLSRLVRP